MNKDITIITCPVCGASYMPSEIYMPDSFFGKQKEIIKNADGSINFYIGDDPDFDENFICESCGSDLHIKANVSFTVTVNEKEEFNEIYEEKIEKPKKIKLDEVNIF